jgi:hypothetical protein
MEIWHHIVFNKYDLVDKVLDDLNINYEKTMGLNDYYLISFDIKESDSRWPEIENLLREKDKPDLSYTTTFSNSEILKADFIRLEITHECGYPQPENGWEDITYEGECHKCGAGYKQIHPFHLKEPKLGRNDFFSVYWTYALFCTPNALAVLQNEKISGYEAWPVIKKSSEQTLQSAFQIYCPHLAKPGLAEQDKLKPETCPICGITKYAYHNRGYMHYKQGTFNPNLDIQMTDEWFGSGGHAGFREFIISNRFAKLIIENKWRGIKMTPIELI